MRPILAAAALLIPAVALAAAIEPPHRKAGWWEVTTSMPAPMAMTQTTHLCTDPETEARTGAFVMRQGPGAGGDCKQQVTRTAQGWNFTSVCTTNGMTMTTTGTATGDFQSDYKVVATTKMDPAPNPAMASMTMTIASRWLGACPAGRKPGDMVMANGMVMNMNAVTGR